VAKKKNRKTTTHLTERALRDIAGIEKFSVREFGRKVANRYLASLEAAISRITEDPSLLRSEPDCHPWLRFYRAEKHLMVCDYQDSGRIIVLTVIHASMDIPSRLTELEPTLMAETELLHQRLHRKK
jgi:toxin ParE1/3/4